MLTIEEIKDLIQNDKMSERKKLAKVGQKYYEAEHDILKYRLFYYNADGKLVEDTTRSNIKISHPFFTELVDQCVQYMLSGTDSFVKSDIPELQTKLEMYFGDSFKSELADVLTDTCAGGFGYIYAYKNKDDKMNFVYAEANGVVEVKASDSDDQTEYIIYYQTERINKGKTNINRIQVWDKGFVHYFVQVGDKEIEKDKDFSINPRPHIVYTQDESKFGESLGFIPFFRLDANRKQTSHLKPIKTLIDDYDLMACGLSNNIQDVSEGFFVVKGFTGNDLDELITNIKVKKHIGVDVDGGVDIKTVDVPFDARMNKLGVDEKNIYRFGMGFNSAQVGDGNITNIVIRSRYALLDLKCNKLEKRLKPFLQILIKIALQEINQTNETGYELKDIYFDFKREIMTNATDNATIAKTEAETQQIILNTILDAASKLDDETVLKAICDLFEINYEEVKSRIPKDPTVDLNAASEALKNKVIIDDVEELAKFK